MRCAALVCCPSCPVLVALRMRPRVGVIYPLPTFFVPWHAPSLMLSGFSSIFLPYTHCISRAPKSRRFLTLFLPPRCPGMHPLPFAQCLLPFVFLPCALARMQGFTRVLWVFVGSRPFLLFSVPWCAGPFLYSCVISGGTCVHAEGCVCGQRWAERYMTSYVRPALPTGVYEAWAREPPLGLLRNNEATALSWFFLVVEPRVCLACVHTLVCCASYCVWHTYLNLLSPPMCTLGTTLPRTYKT